MKRLEKLIQGIIGKHVYIQTHNFPDPDAISSAYGMKRLLEHYDISSTICYKGKIDRSALAEMIRCLHIEIVNIDDIEGMTLADEVILVDAQKGNANIMDIPGDEVICIDHHPIYEQVDYRVVDIRPDVGACASIVAEYYFENQIEMDREVATALLFGIKIDTANLTRGVSDLDLEMFYKIYRRADKKLMNLFELNTLQFDDLHAYAYAISTIKVYDSISFANTGKNCPEALIANISDFMLALSEVKFSVVYSVRGDGVKLSIRNALPDLDAGKIANEALKEIGNGGGHASMAGGFAAYSEQLPSERLLIAKIEERFLSVIEQMRQELSFAN